MVEKVDIKKHIFIPEHKKLSEDEKKKILKKYGITVKHLPKILIDDPGIVNLNVKQEDVIKITRKSPTAGVTEFYRGVINE